MITESFNSNNFSIKTPLICQGNQLTQKALKVFNGFSKSSVSKELGPYANAINFVPKEKRQTNYIPQVKSQKVEYLLSCSPSSDNQNSDSGASTNTPPQESSIDCQYSELKYKKPKKNFHTKKDRKEFVRDFKAKEKTELCINWQVYGRCKHGDACCFAHGEGELRKKVNVRAQYKTCLCKKFTEGLICSYGARCQYIHNHFTVQKQKTTEYSRVLKENNDLACERLQLLEDSYVPAELSENLLYISTYQKKRLNVFRKLAGDK